MTAEESARTRKHLSLSEKVEVISFFNNVKCSVRKLAKYFNIGKTQAGHIVKQKDKLLELWFANGEIKNGKLRPDSIGYQIDKYVYKWYTDTRNENIQVSGPMIQNKALEIAKELGHEEFKASNGWLERFRIRHKINQKLSKQGKNAPNPEQWREKLDSIASTYAAGDIFVAAETGLFYRSTPEETPALTSEVLLDGDVSDMRVTVLLCANLAGGREKPLVVVKTPTAAESDPGAFPPNCAFAGSARLSRDIAVKWLGEFCSRNRGSALLLGGALSELLLDARVPDVELLHAPASLFPEGFSGGRSVRDFKIAYRQLLLKRLVELKENDEDSASISRMGPAEGAALIEAAWEAVGESSLLANFSEVGCDVAKIAKDGGDVGEASLDDVSSLLCALDSDVSAVDYVSVDADLPTVDAGGPEVLEVLVDGEGVGGILAEEDGEAAARDRLLLPDVYDAGAPDAFSVGSYSEALCCLKGLEQFYLSQNDSASTVLVNQLIVQNEKAENERLKNAIKMED